MQFFSTILISTLVLGSSVLAAPTEFKERSAAASANPVTAVTAIINSVGGSLPGYTSAISNAVNSIKGTAGGDVAAAEGLINSNLASIVSTLTSATGSLVTATSGLVNGAGGAALGLVQADVTQLISTIQKTTSLLTSIQNNLLSIATLVPAVQSTLAGEISAVKAAINPFVAPINKLATAVEGQAGLQTSGVVNAISGLQAIAASLVSSQTS